MNGIQIAGINKSYGNKQVLFDIDWTIDINDPGIVCLMGENGAGKSTLLKIISGVLQQNSGSIFVSGESGANVSYEILLFVRMGISVAASITIFVTVTLALMTLWGWSLHECFSCLKALMIGLPVVTGMFGMGLVFGAAVLNEKDIGKSVIIVQAVLLFFSNVFSTVKFKWILLFPYTWGIDLGRNIYMEKPLILTDVLIYAAVNLIWLMIGHALFARALRKERLHGMFDNY